MNWMTSGRHRALRSKRGKKRSEMHFPAHVQRRETAARVLRHPLAAAEPAGGAQTRTTSDQGATAWYIRPILNADESHDIQMLELAREAAASTFEASGSTSAAPSTPKQAASAAANHSSLGGGAGGKDDKTTTQRRCVFTPVKANRSRASDVLNRPLKKAKSPSPRGLLLFNEGEQLSKPVPGLPVASTTLKHEFQSNESAPCSARWSNDARDADERGKHRDSRSETPFYAASSPSSDEDLSEKDVSDRKHEWSTLKRHESKMRYSIEPKRCREATSRKRPSMLDEIDLALNARTAMQLDDGLKPCPRGNNLFAEGRSFTPPPQRQSQPQLPQFQPALFNCHQDAQQEHPTTSNHGQASHLGVVEDSLESASMIPNAVSFNHAETQRREFRPERLPTEEYVAHEESKETDSSQGSFVLPPPVDWQKVIITRYNETTQQQHVKAGDFQENTCMANPGDDAPPISAVPNRVYQPIQHHSVDGSLTATWRSTSRTRSILVKVEGGLSRSRRENSEAEENLQLRRKLREKDTIIIYMHTILQCHKIDQAFEAQECSNTPSKFD